MLRQGRPAHLMLMPTWNNNQPIIIQLSEVVKEFKEFKEFREFKELKVFKEYAVWYTNNKVMG